MKSKPSSCLWSQASLLCPRGISFLLLLGLHYRWCLDQHLWRCLSIPKHIWYHTIHVVLFFDFFFKFTVLEYSISAHQTYPLLLSNIFLTGLTFCLPLFLGYKFISDSSLLFKEIDGSIIVIFKVKTSKPRGVRGYLAVLELKPRSSGLVSGVIPCPTLPPTKAKGTQRVLMIQRTNWRLPLYMHT